MLLVASLLPPVFFLLSLPIRRFTLNRIPLLKMLLYIISHLYFIALLSLTIAFKLDWRTTQDNLLIPRWNEWLLGETHTFLIRIINTKKNKLIPRWNEWLLGETHTFLIRIINTQKNKLIPR